MALFEKDDRHVAETIPEGGIVQVDSVAFDGDKLVEVIWNGKRVMMFAQDLRKRGEIVKRQAE